VTARLRASVAAAMFAVVVGGCGQTFDNLVTGTFDGGKLIALNNWVGGNSIGTNIDAYADVSDQTAATLDINGQLHWRCAGVFRAPSYVPSTGGLFESDKDRMRDKVVRLPSLVLTGETAPGIGFTGPIGTYRVTIELPSPTAKFNHSWQLGITGPITGLSVINPACTQVADTLMQQRSIADLYLSALKDRLDGASPSTIRTQLQAFLDQARRAKISGDSRAVSDERAADYQSAAAVLTKIVQLATDSAGSGLSPTVAFQSTELATNAAALLLQTGLS
jgi:hypothetical protein